MSCYEGLITVGEEGFSILSQFYQHDRDLPLRARTLQRVENETYLREKIVFRGLHNSRVPGILTLPAHGSRSYPCILLAHGMGGSKEERSTVGPEGTSITQELLSAGFSVLALDGPWQGERMVEIDYESIYSYIRPNNYRELIVQWTVEHRLALDYLERRAEIDSRRIGILGYSLGGVMTFNLAGLEPRLKAAVTASTVPLSRHYMQRIGWDETALQRMSPIAPQTFAPEIKSASFLMLNGIADPYSTPELLQELYAAIACPDKELVLFDSGHALPEEHRRNTVEWFQKYI